MPAPNPVASIQAGPGPGLAPTAVLDTNVVLDCWVFRDPRSRALATALDAGTLRWLACERMREELARALTYPQLAKWSPDAEQVLRTFDRLATVGPPPGPSVAALHCRDPDDQVFIDLAVARSARWLFSHDRAVLRMARHARLWGVSIVAPTQWQPA